MFYNIYYDLEGIGCAEANHHHPERGRGHGHRGHHRNGPRHGLHSGRKISSGDLQLIILALLEKSPAHGYELIKSIEEVSDKFYVPSPGMIYPSLTYLEEINYARVETDGSRKRYHVTEAGSENLQKNREHVDGILAELSKIGSRMEEARRALSGEESREPETDGQTEELRRVRHELKAFFRSSPPANPSEELRIAKIFQTALADAKGETINKPLSPEDVLALIKARRSMGLSRLSDKAVDRALIERMLEAANWAPSHEDTEPWRFSVFMGDGREKLALHFARVRKKDDPNIGPPTDEEIEWGRKRAFAAPVWISIGMSPKLTENHTLLMSEEEELMAVACAVQNLHLMAQATGLAGMWHSKGSSIHPAVAAGLGLEPPSKLLGFFMCGWPSGEWTKGERGPLAEKVNWIE